MTNTKTKTMTKTKTKLPPLTGCQDFSHLQRAVLQGFGIILKNDNLLKNLLVLLVCRKETTKSNLDPTSSMLVLKHKLSKINHASFQWHVSMSDQGIKSGKKKTKTK